MENFNRTQNGQYDPRLNVALVGTTQSNCSATASTVAVQSFTVDPTSVTTASYTSPSTLSISTSSPPGTYFRLAAGDLQGRSIPVGPPEKRRKARAAM